MRMARLVNKHVVWALGAFMIFSCDGTTVFAVDLTADINAARVGVSADNNLKLTHIGNRLLGKVEERPDRKKFIVLPFVTIDVNGASAKLYNLKEKEGALIVQITDSSGLDGIAVNDVIVGLDGISIKSSEHLGSIMSRIHGTNSVVIRISSKGLIQEKRINVSSLPTNLGFAVSMSDGEMTCHVENGIVLVSPVLLQFVESDDELAFVLAIEIAHTRLGHERTMVNDTRADATQALITAVFSSLVGSRYVTNTYSVNLMSGPYKIEDEIKADRFAVDLLKKSGFDSGAAYTFLTKVETEIAKTNNAYSKSYSKIHPVSVDRIALLKKYMEELKNDKDSKLSPEVDSTTHVGLEDKNLKLGATMNNGVQVDEYKLRLSVLSEKFAGHNVYSGSVFYNNVEYISWIGAIEESYQMFEVGFFKVELYDPSGTKKEWCEGSYAVSGTEENIASCDIPMNHTKNPVDPGIWKVKVFRGNTLIDERQILIKSSGAPKAFLKKRSEIMTAHSSAKI